MVQGSQAHQAQTMEFHGETFVHYGLGNFFFDQMWSDGTRQEFVDRLTFYDGRLLNIDLRTAILEEYGRPRPMTVGDTAPEADRREFLRMIFSLRP
jgi:poly-gamma-glutamate synthesis protein (capsule biosynthesis protein)